LLKNFAIVSSQVTFAPQPKNTSNQMKKLFICILSLTSFFANAQETLTFTDGTTIDVIGADLTTQGIRKWNIGFVSGFDGLSDFRFFNVNYLKPEKFYAGMNVGFASLTAEGILFFAGKEKIKKKRIPLRHIQTGYRTATVYTTVVEVQKRKELGAYAAISDYGTLFNMYGKDSASRDDVMKTGFSELTVVYGGIARVSYWGYNVVMENGKAQSHSLTRTILAPFYVVNGARASYGNNEQIPSYGVRLAWEGTKSSKWLNFGAKVGLDGFKRRGQDPSGDKSEYGAALILAVGLGVSF
jgi:hypothetical protein